VLSALAIATSIFVSAPLLAQGGPDDELPQPKPANPDEKPPSTSNANDYITREELNEVVEEAVKARLKKERRTGGLLSSDSGLGLWVGGGIELEYHGVQENHKPTTLTARRRAKHGLNFDKAWLFVEGSWDDQSAKSEFEIARGRVSIEATANDAYADEAYVWFNRPLTRFSIPVLKVYAADNLLVGLADPFWKNQHRIGEQHALHQEAFARDERLQLTYTLTVMQTIYMIGGLATGTRLALTGDIDESGNYPILQDDRESYWTNQGNANQVRRSPEFIWGFGFAIPTTGDSKDYTNKIIHPKRPFSPAHVTSHTNVLHFGMWGVSGGLSTGERALIDDAAGVATGSMRRWRYGVVGDLIHSFGDHVGYLRAEIGQSADGSLRRDFGSIEAAMAFHTSSGVPVLRSVTPFARYSLMTASFGRIAADNTTAAASAAENGALATADRYQFTAGVRLGLHEFMSLVFEYTWNLERLGTGPVTDVDNDLWLLSLRVNF